MTRTGGYSQDMLYLQSYTGRDDGEGYGFNWAKAKSFPSRDFLLPYTTFNAPKVEIMPPPQTQCCLLEMTTVAYPDVLQKFCITKMKKLFIFLLFTILLFEKYANTQTCEIDKDLFSLCIIKHAKFDDESPHIGQSWFANLRLLEVLLSLVHQVFYPLHVPVEWLVGLGIFVKTQFVTANVPILTGLQPGAAKSLN
ncbi:hypothetical protein E2320_015648 [Naja naja]|nr:hypothetical protein E2320_015648 [Naja naja]